jgi:rSAM/selenodomain-associated transferase 1
MLTSEHETRRTLGLFAKRPAPGQVKTRLAAATSAEWAARVAEAFLLDLLEALASFDARKVLAFAPPSERGYFVPVTQGRFELTPQHDGDLGQRMAHFFAEQFAQHAERVVLVGTDAPTLPVPCIEQAFEELKRADVVLGPATDGGYYLIGCARCVPPIFDGIAWSSPSVLAETIAAIAAARLRLALLSPWYDVDTLEDWRMLQGHLAALRQSGHDPGLRHIAALPPPP